MAYEYERARLEIEVLDGSLVIAFKSNSCVASCCEDLRKQFKDLFWSFMKCDCSTSDEIGGGKNGCGRGKVGGYQ